MNKSSEITVVTLCVVLPIAACGFFLNTVVMPVVAGWLHSLPGIGR